jgi:hypothetical protein
MTPPMMPTRVKGGRNGVENLAGDRGYEGEHHDGEDETGGQHADAVRRAGEELVEHRDVGESVDQEGLHVRLKPGCKHEQAPDAIDDAGDAGQQLNGGADGALQALRTNLGEKDCDAEADGNPDKHGDSRGDDRPVDRRQGTELLSDRVPFFCDQEVEAEGAPGWQRAMHQSGDDAGE